MQRNESSGSDIYKFAYGPTKSEITLQKSKNLLGIKIRPGICIDVLQESLGKELKLNLVDKIGDFHIFQVNDNQNIESVINIIDKKDIISKITHVYKTPADEKSCFIPTGGVYIKFKEGLSTKLCLVLLEKYNLNKGKPRGERAFVTQVTSGLQNPIHVASQLQKDSQVEVAEPDLAARLQRQSI